MAGEMSDDWQPYRSWGPKSRYFVARVCGACGASTHWPARDGWRWRIVYGTRAKQGQVTEACCPGCAAVVATATAE